MISSTPQIHRLPIIDDQHNQTGDYALLQVTAAPEKVWPLHLEATGGQSSYRAKVSRAEISTLREKKNQKSKDEWESLVLKCLCRRPDDSNEHASQNEELEVFAALTPDELSIIIRKNIGEVKQRLGEIPIKLDEEYEIDVLGWCHHAVERSDTLASEQSSLQAKFSDQQAAISSLEKRLEDLIVAKKEHESALMAKFVEVLNTKKLKIRDQQRLLATIKIDDVQAAKVREKRQGATATAPVRSRNGKRKAATFTDDEDQEDDEEAFGDIKAEAEGERDSEEEEARKTDEGSAAGDDTTDDEDEDETMTSKSRPSKTSPVNNTQNPSSRTVIMDDLPPVRELPFGRKSSPEKTTATAKATRAPSGAPDRQQDADDDETTDDDEL